MRARSAALGLWMMMVGCAPASESNLVDIDAGSGQADAGSGQAPEDAGVTVPTTDFEYVSFAKGGLHSHSTRSDGRQSIDESVAAYKAAVFDFLATTDHDYASRNDEFTTRGFVSLAGEEVSPWFNKPDGTGVFPHVGSICGNGVTVGLTPEGDALWRSPAVRIEDPMLVEDVLVESLVETIDDVREIGQALPVLNHPNFRRGLNSEILLRVSEDAPFSLLEIANQNDAVETAPDATHEGDEEIWDVLLTAGHHVFGLATDDSHGAEAINQGFIQVATSGSSTDLCRAIAAGKFYASTGVALSAIRFSKGVLALEITGAADPAAYETQFIGAGGVVLETQTGLEPSIDTSALQLDYVRAKVTDPEGKSAWTQPVFL